MSIRDEINRMIGLGTLFNVDLVIPGDSADRTMVVSSEIWSLFQGPWENISMERRSLRLRADLEAFVKGDVISMCLNQYHHQDAYMGRLDRPEDEVWDVRSRDPKPGLRVFGRFAEQDTFVALNWSPRSVEWANQQPLGDVATLNWDFAILECQERWNKLFPGYHPVHGDDVHVYVASNVISI